jgi:hypothetical protein
MEKRPFWICDMRMKGSRRINSEDLEAMDKRQRKSLQRTLRISPGWCEISYLNKMENIKLTAREFLLGWVFATLKEQHGFALAVAKKGRKKFGLPLFEEMKSSSWSALVLGSGKISRLFQALGVHRP